MRGSRSLLLAAVGLSLLVAAGVSNGGCRHQEVIVKTADGKKLRAEDIDRDPTALLPGGALGVGRLDARALYGSPLGQAVLGFMRRHAPLPPGAEFDPERDLLGLWIGIYSMQGADFAGIASGRFRPAAIEAAADGIQQTPLGVPVVRTLYAERKLYTAGELGFVVLTEHTLLFGNETGIRRVLDRLARGRIQREIPPWADDLLGREDVPFALAVDLGSNPVSAAVREELPFSAGLGRLRVVGNFADSGVNLAGTGVYGDEGAAEVGARQVNDIEAMVRSWGWLAAIAGIPQPVRRTSALTRGREVDFVIGLDAAATGRMIEQLSQTLGATKR